MEARRPYNIIAIWDVFSKEARRQFALWCAVLSMREGGGDEPTD